jgi:hypothetical protein
VLPFELVAQVVERAVDLPADRLRPIVIFLGKALFGFQQGLVFLLDAEHLTGTVDHDEVDLAETHPLP